VAVVSLLAVLYIDGEDVVEVKPIPGAFVQHLRHQCKVQLTSLRRQRRAIKQSKLHIETLCSSPLGNEFRWNQT
ncbi:MAG: hypothetical protein AAFY34_07925, partial [Pseudomonadota bacterium]